jgi:hypothetical protein
LEKFVEGNIQNCVYWVGIVYVVCTNVYPTLPTIIVAMNGFWFATITFAIGVPVGVQKSEIRMT